jgi:hypothetical protein
MVGRIARKDYRDVQRQHMQAQRLYGANQRHGKDVGFQQ